jgi:hypothetical protein
LRQYSFAKKFQNVIKQRKAAQNTISYEKGARKMLVKLTHGGASDLIFSSWEESQALTVQSSATQDHK